MYGRLIGTAAFAAAVILTITASASADVKVGARHQLRPEVGTRSLDTAARTRALQP